MALTAGALPARAQDSSVPPSRGNGRRPTVVITDTARARELFVSKDPKDLAGCGSQCAVQIAAKHRTDSIYAARAPGLYEFRKVTYKSRADGLEIPAYLFAPIDKSPSKHAALVWVHGGVHGDWNTLMFPFVREAVQRGYVVITPDYRGSTGYGDAYYKLIDYGGKEVDDVLSAVDYLQTLPYVDMDRLGIMGWSHGGFITSHILFRGKIPFRAGAAIVPVTNLIFRLSDHGPGYQRSYAPEPGIQGLPFENTEEYIKRSPIFHVQNLEVPMLVHVATNDCDVYFREDQQMIYTLRALKPDLAETKIYVDPPYRRDLGGCGHTFSRRVDPATLERDDTPEQIDSWERTWTFFEWNLRPRTNATTSSR
jgi:dipeptidyl aminopeptidase/acylaminoacyl peptidase